MEDAYLEISWCRYESVSGVITPGDEQRVDEINQRISEAGSKSEEPKTAGLDLGSPVERSNGVCS